MRYTLQTNHRVYPDLSDGYANCQHFPENRILSKQKQYLRRV